MLGKVRRSRAERKGLDACKGPCSLDVDDGSDGTPAEELSHGPKRGVLGKGQAEGTAADF